MPVIDLLQLSPHDTSWMMVACRWNWQ